MNNKDKKETDLSGLSREELEKKYVQLNTKYNSTIAKLNWYLEQYRLAMQKRYGKSSEKEIDGQINLSDLPLFNEAETFREPFNVENDLSKYSEAEKNVDISISNKKKKSRKKSIDNLPVVTDVYELTKEEQICPNCKSVLHEMKEKVRVTIEIIPAKVQVHKYISKIYACRNCEKNNSVTLITAPGFPAPVIPGSIASSSAIASIISAKYVDATPFYRQEQNFKRRLVPITRNNMCNWSIKVANDYFKLLEKKMRSILYKEGAIHCDELCIA